MVSIAANDGIGNPVRDPFPGITAPATTGAPGSVPDRTPPPDSDIPAGISGVPGVGTVMPVRLQAANGESTSTSQPGQTAESVISPGPAQDYASQGPFPNSYIDHWGRHDWQADPELHR